MSGAPVTIKLSKSWIEEQRSRNLPFLATYSNRKPDYGYLLVAFGVGVAVGLGIAFFIAAQILQAEVFPHIIGGQYVL